MEQLGAALGLMLMLWLAYRWLRRRPRATAADKAPDASRARSQRNRKGVGTAPTRWLERWQITYGDTKGQMTSRTVRVIEVQPRLERLRCWCELRNDERIFFFAGLESVADADTGAPVDFDAWLERHRLSRRRGASPSQTRDTRP